MAKKKKIQETTIEDFYDLKVDKIDELVAALKGDGTEEADSSYESMNIGDCTGVDDPGNYTRTGKQKKFNPYKTDFLRNVPTWLKALFIKWWFSGAICLFIIMGLGTYISSNLDLLVLTGVVLGMVVDVLVNPLFRYMESDEREYDAFMMFPFPFKAFWTFFTNILYYILVIVCVNYIYYGINVLCNITGANNFWMEPLLFGVFTLIVDMIFIGIKDGIVCLVRHSRKKEKVNV